MKPVFWCAKTAGGGSLLVRALPQNHTPAETQRARTKKTLALHGIIFNYYWEGPYLRVLFS